MPWLAQSSTRSAGDVVLWVIILAGAVVVGGIVILWLRSRMLSGDDDDASPEGLLEELRKSLERGDITQQEFRIARDSVLEGASGKPRARQKLLRGEVHDDGSIRAKPGFDLLGEPLPEPSQTRESDQSPDAPQ